MGRGTVVEVASRDLPIVLAHLIVFLASSLCASHESEIHHLIALFHLEVIQ